MNQNVSRDFSQLREEWGHMNVDVVQYYDII